MQRTILTLLGAGLAAGLLAAEPAAQSRIGSIYNPDLGPQSMVADKTARRSGDLLTVLITENQDVANEESSILSKETKLDYGIDSFDILPNAFNPLPNIEAESQDDFSGTANYQKKGSFVARMTVIVIDVLPNGNLIVKGRREIRVDYELKVIEFSGIVRPYDVAADNTVRSELVAEARISYTGEGVLTNATNRTGLGRILHSLISWLWPF